VNVLLVHPPAKKRGLSLGEHLGLGYIASALRREGFEVDILDAYLQELSPRRTCEEVARRSFSVLGVSVYQATFENAIEVIRAARRSSPEAQIVAGGYYPTLSPADALRRLEGVDGLLVGEGELAMVEIARSVAGGCGLPEVRGLVERARGLRKAAEDAEIAETARANVIESLDSLPFPARDTLPYALGRGLAAQVASSRGCPAGCLFCSIHAFYSRSGDARWRARSPEGVVDEVEALHVDHGVDFVKFVDDTFVGPGERGKRRAIAIAEEMMRRRLEVAFSVQSRPDEVDPEVYRALRRAGLRSAFLGVESAVPRALGDFGKGVTAEDSRLAVRTLQDLGVRVEVGMILFDPFTRLGEIRENLAFLSDLLGDDGFFQRPQRLKVYPGTPLAARLGRAGLIEGDFPHLGYVCSDPRVDSFFEFWKRLYKRLKPLYRRLPEQSAARRRIARLFVEAGFDALDALEAAGADSGALSTLWERLEADVASIERAAPEPRGRPPGSLREGGEPG